jgi:ABC-type spermidine/putrescine transport system permease subunit II
MIPAATRRAIPLSPVILGVLLVVLYAFLYAPILYVIYTSISADIVWPFPPALSLQSYADLFDSSLYAAAMGNSLIIGFGSAIISTILATAAGIGLLRHRSRRRGLALLVLLAPLFVADLLIGISTLAFNARVLGLSGNIYSAIAGNAIQGTSFALLIILSQLVRYDWQMDEAAMVFGAGPVRCFLEITLPTIWPCLLGAFLIAFILGFNNLEISFYNLGAIPTLPSVAWGSLRFGLGPELFALAALTNGLVFVVFAVMYGLMRTGIVRFGYRGR